VSPEQRGMRLASDLGVGLLFVLALWLLSVMPPDAGSRAKRLAWDGIEIAFQVVLWIGVAIVCGPSWARQSWQTWREKRRGKP